MSKRAYEKPTVTVFEASEVAELLGPAQASGASQSVSPLPAVESPRGRSGSKLGR